MQKKEEDHATSSLVARVRLAFHYIVTDLFWRHREKKIQWLEKEIKM
jgi:hypothetical protein